MEGQRDEAEEKQRENNAERRAGKLNYEYKYCRTRVSQGTPAETGLPCAADSTLKSDNGC